MFRCSSNDSMKYYHDDDRVETGTEFERISYKEYQNCNKGVYYNLGDMDLDFNDEYIFEKIKNGYKIFDHEFEKICKQCDSGQDYDKLREILTDTCSDDKTELKITKELILSSDHDGYCSGSECEFGAILKYVVSISDYTDDFDCSCDLNNRGSGYCGNDEKSANYMLRSHECDHLILEKHFKSITKSDYLSK